MADEARGSSERGVGVSRSNFTALASRRRCATPVQGSKTVLRGCFTRALGNCGGRWRSRSRSLRYEG